MTTNHVIGGAAFAVDRRGVIVLKCGNNPTTTMPSANNHGGSLTPQKIEVPTLITDETEKASVKIAPMPLRRTWWQLQKGERNVR